MTWSDSHDESERLAVQAQLAAREGDSVRSRGLYTRAARAETQALSTLDTTKIRTLAVTVVSAAALWYKAGELRVAECLAHEWLGKDQLPPFAADQLREIITEIWAAQSLESLGIQFTGSEVLVSVGGGEVVRGGAPLDLIQQKVEQVSAMFYRTAELLLNKPLRKRGAPEQGIREACRPWLFQANAGSYQFAVRVQKPKQGVLFPEHEVNVEQVSRQFLQIVKAVAEDPEDALRSAVPDDQYRATFLKMARNLSPTGRSFSRLTFRSATSPEVEPIVLRKEARDQIRSALKSQFPNTTDDSGEERVELRGILRAVHLDEDWIEIAINANGRIEHKKVYNVADELDDVLGPLVNHVVVVDATKGRNERHTLREIQPGE